MTDRTINQLTTTTSAAGADLLPIWVTGSGVTRAVTKANFMGGALTGGGTLATGGFTLTVPATGTAALRDVAGTFSAAQTFTATLTATTLAIGDYQAAQASTGVTRQRLTTGFSLNAAGIAGVTGMIWGVFSAIIEVTGVGTYAAICTMDTAAVTVVSGSSAVSGTADTANRINFYIDSGIFYIQNSFSAAANIRLLVFST